VNKQTNSIRDKISKHKKAIVISIPIVVIFLLYWFAVPQNIVNYSTLGSKNNSEILGLIKKDHPNAVSVEVMKKYPLEKERCLINLGIFLEFACNWFEVDAYEYYGFYTISGANFSMPFRAVFTSSAKQGEVESYGDIEYPLNQQWKSFISFFNKTGYKRLLSIEGPYSYWNRDAPKPSTAIAGYEYEDLYIMCGSDIDYYKPMNQQSYECDDSPSPVHHSRSNGSYLVYYDNRKKEWSILTKDNNYFWDWVNKQDSTLDAINWTNSPIKSYSQ
jgi:hypothetical protein